MSNGLSRQSKEFEIRYKVHIKDNKTMKNMLTKINDSPYNLGF